MYRVLSAMAARSEISPARWRRPLLNWMDGAEAGWAIPLLLAGFGAVWLLFVVIADLGADLHPDVLESWTLGRSLEWGYARQPPLIGWIARAWMSVFPLANWSFQLLALTNAAIALWAVDLLARRFASAEKRIIVLLLLMLLPIYQFHAERFNANALMLVTWPIATYCFLRSFETREIGWAVAAGATAALAMLGNYYSVFLIVGFLIAAICHPQRHAYFASLAPGVSTFVMVAALGPHLHWLWTTGARPIAYALARHTGNGFGSALIDAVLFILGIAALLAIPAMLWALMTVDRFREFSFDRRTMDSGLLLLFLVGVGTILLPPLVSIALGADISPLWGLQGLFLFVIPMVCAASDRIERFHAVNLAALAAGIALFAAVVAAPAYAWYRTAHPSQDGRQFYSLAADELTRQWHARSDAELASVGGDDGLALAVAFYSPDHPVYEARLVPPTADTLPPRDSVEQGWAALCYDGDADCLAAMERIAAASRPAKTEFTVQSSLLGRPGATQGFIALLVPPAGEQRTAPLSPPPPLPSALPPPPAGATPAAPEMAAVPARRDEPTCCERRPEPDNAEPSADLALRPALVSNDSDAKPSRGAAPPAVTEFAIVGPEPTPPSQARDGFARLARPARVAHAKPATARAGAGAKPAFLMCNDAPDRHRDRRGDRSGSQPLSARLEHQFCSMSADLDRKLQFWRGDKAKSGVKRRAPDRQGRRI